jgi:integrase
VNRALQWMKGGGWQFQDTKRTGSRRTVKLPNAICALLEKRRTVQAKDRTDAGQNWQNTDLIFTTRTGGPLDERNIAQENFSRILTAGRIARNQVVRSKAYCRHERAHSRGAAEGCFRDAWARERGFHT